MEVGLTIIWKASSPVNFCSSFSAQRMLQVQPRAMKVSPLKSYLAMNCSPRTKMDRATEKIIESEAITEKRIKSRNGSAQTSVNNPAAIKANPSQNLHEQ